MSGREGFEQADDLERKVRQLEDLMRMVWCWQMAMAVATDEFAEPERRRGPWVDGNAMG